MLLLSLILYTGATAQAEGRWPSEAEYVRERRQILLSPLEPGIKRGKLAERDHLHSEGVFQASLEEPKNLPSASWQFRLEPQAGCDRPLWNGFALCDGDILLGAAASFNNAVTGHISESFTEYSHSLVVFWDTKHAKWLAVESRSTDGVRVSTLGHALDLQTMSKVLVYRHPQGRQIFKQGLNAFLNKYQGNTEIDLHRTLAPYDAEFDAQDDRQLYCVEVVSLIYRLAGLVGQDNPYPITNWRRLGASLSQARIREMAGIKVQSMPYPQDLELSSRFKWVGYWLNPEVLRSQMLERVAFDALAGQLSSAGSATDQLFNQSLAVFGDRNVGWLQEVGLARWITPRWPALAKLERSTLLREVFLYLLTENVVIGKVSNPWLGRLRDPQTLGVNREDLGREILGQIQTETQQIWQKNQTLIPLAKAVRIMADMFESLALRRLIYLCLAVFAIFYVKSRVEDNYHRQALEAIARRAQTVPSAESVLPKAPPAPSEVEVSKIYAEKIRDFYKSGPVPSIVTPGAVPAPVPSIRPVIVPPLDTAERAFFAGLGESPHAAAIQNLYVLSRMPEAKGQLQKKYRETLTEFARDPQGSKEIVNQAISRLPEGHTKEREGLRQLLKDLESPPAAKRPPKTGT